jgi:hypothetical protein
MLGYKICILLILIIVLSQIVNINKEKYTSVIRSKIKIVGNKIFKTHNKQNTYFRIKKLYNETLHEFDFVPKMEFNDKNLKLQKIISKIN